MFFILLASIPIAIASYTILAQCMHIPAFKVSFSLNNRNKVDAPKKNPLAFLETLSKPLAKYMPVSFAKEIKMERLLQRAGSAETPKEFTARLLITFLFIMLLGLPFAFINRWLLLIPLLVGSLFTISQHGNIKEKAQKQQENIEKEIPQFIEHFTHNYKSNHNAVAIFDVYIQNYNTYLSRELAKTVVDMRTGSQELALQRFDTRINNPLMSQLTRGIIATLRGDDMTVYFADLTTKVERFRAQRMMQLAYKIQPKIAIMSNLRAVWSLCILLVIAVAGLFTAMSSM